MRSFYGVGSYGGATAGPADPSCISRVSTVRNGKGARQIRVEKHWPLCDLNYVEQNRSRSLGC